MNNHSVNRFNMRQLLRDPKTRRELLVKSIYSIRIMDDPTMTMERADAAYDHAQSPFGYNGSCLACNVESQEGSHENPHPIPRYLHTCVKEEDYDE